jgi:hypothetical protein
VALGASCLQRVNVSAVRPEEGRGGGELLTLKRPAPFFASPAVKDCKYVFSAASFFGSPCYQISTVLLANCLISGEVIVRNPGSS